MNIVKQLFLSSIGKKYVMALTGCLLFGFVLVHLLGNMQFYLGQEALNSYAALLQGNRALLWGFRLGLLAIATIHITTAIWLALENRAARPIPYLKDEPPYASYASSTMLMSGLIMFAFIVLHLLHYTIGVVQPDIMHFLDAKQRHDVYRMMVNGFSNPWVSGFYVLALGLLYFHLSHGISSIFQSLGLKNRHYTGLIAGFAQVAALVIFLGNCSIPVAIMVGLAQ